MSSDATYILIENQQPQYFYSRWGALNLARDLLQGPEQFRRHIAGLEARKTPMLENYLSGLVELDADRRRLRYWASDGFGRNAVCRRMYQALLARQWPGWALEWLDEPARTMQAPQARIVRATASIAEMQAWQDEAWQRARPQWVNFEQDLAEMGENWLRNIAEWDTHCTWVTVRSEQGLRDDRLADGIPAGRVFLAGPDLLQLLDVRPQRNLAEIAISESDILACCYIDLPGRQFAWWCGEVWWPEILNIAQAWPGWQTHRMTQGPPEQLALSGRDPQALLSLNCLQQLATWFASLIGSSVSPGTILANIAGSLQREPDTQVRITPPGPGSDGSDSAPGWEQQIRQHYRELLQTAAFQPGQT
jgi:hypothetical protein